MINLEQEKSLLQVPPKPITSVGWVPGLEGWNYRFQFQLVKTESKSNLIFETGSGTKTRFSVFKSIKTESELGSQILKNWNWNQLQKFEKKLKKWTRTRG
jgi:hypothetical protein